MNKHNIIMSENELALRSFLKQEGTPSWQSRFFTGLLRLLPIKRQTATAEAVQRRVRKLALHPPSHKPVGLGAGVNVTLQQFAGWPVYYTSPAAGTPVHHYVVFLHGGGYINEIVKAHWKILGTLTRSTGVHCVVPIYPLAPKGTASKVVPVVGALLRQLLQDAGTAKVTLMGNSAGAGMAVAAAQWLRDNGHPQPFQLLLISPGLDATVSSPEQQQLAATDPIQDIPGMQEGARLYAAELDITHPYVSPLRGDLHGLAPMMIFSGTLDLLYPDSIALATKARAAGVAVELHLRRGQIHNYVALPTPEGKEAMALIMKAVSNKG